MQSKVKTWEHESFGKGKVLCYHMTEGAFSDSFGRLRALLVPESLRLHFD